MNRTSRYVNIATALITALFLLPWSFRSGRAAAGILPAHTDTILPGHLIVKFKQRPPILGKSTPITALPLSDKLRRMLQAAGAISARPAFPATMIRDALWRERLSRIIEIEFDPAVPVRSLAAALQKDDRIEYAEPIYVRRLAFVPNDPGITLQNYLNIIQAPQAWDITHGDSTVVIAIVDTGVDWQHPDLAPNLWRNPGEIPGNGLDDDGNGYIDDVHGWDFANNDNDPKNYASTAAAAHGTHVAGLAAAAGNNGLGVAGLAFGCRLMILKAALDTPSAPAADGIIYGFRAIAYAIENGADVINLSWGGPGSSQVEQDIIRYAVSRGVVVVAAAGNSQSEQPFYPAAYEHVLAVAATNLNDERANFSNFGHWLDLTAPGIGLYSTWPGKDYRFMSGTSMAAPLVAAAAALVKSQHPDWSAVAIAQQLRQTADPISDKNPDHYYKLGRGRLNVVRALTETRPVSAFYRRNFRIKAEAMAMASLSRAKSWNCAGG
ncbi:MAG: S8 family peptidase [candidate division KSB1 bacterium]|nr:S8 family peptidase [candidate division KSB1 bacterium]